MKELFQNENDTLIREIIQSEWQMFDKVQNIGGRADCQDNDLAFFAMRYSQLATWDGEVLESYLQDHKTANETGANLVEQKYAYMMIYTDPVYFANQLARFLPPLTDGRFNLADRIMVPYTQWYEQAKESYPAFVSHGRPENEAASGDGTTSVDAYMRGELFSYSDATLIRFVEMVERRQQENRNMALEIYENTAKCYGFQSLAEAEQAIRRKESGNA